MGREPKTTRNKYNVHHVPSQKVGVLARGENPFQDAVHRVTPTQGRAVSKVDGFNNPPSECAIPYLGQAFAAQIAYTIILDTSKMTTELPYCTTH